MRDATSQLNGLFERYYDRLVAYCRRHTYPWLSDPEDLVHSVYIKCQKRWGPPRGSKAAEIAYLFTAVRWVAIDAGRKTYRRCRHEMQVARDRRDCFRADPAERALAMEAVSTLTGRQRQLCLAMLDGMSERQAAERFGLSPVAVRVTLSRAKARLLAAFAIPEG